MNSNRILGSTSERRIMQGACKRFLTISVIVMVIVGAQALCVTGTFAQQPLVDLVEPKTRHLVAREGNSRDVLNLLNEGFAKTKIRVNGEYDRLYTKWFGKMILPAEVQEHIALIEIATVVGTFLFGVSLTLLIVNFKIRRDKRCLEHALEARNKTEKQLQHLSHIVEQCGLGIASCDLQGNLLSLNEAFAQMHGNSVAELVGKPISALHLPNHMPVVEAANKQVLETGNFEGEIWHVRKDGSIFPGIMQNSIFRDDSGTPIGIIGTLRDISVLKEVEQTLKESEEIHRLTLENISAAAFVVDNTGDFVFICPHVSVIFGYPFREIEAAGNICWMLGADFLDFLELKDSDEITNIERVISDKDDNKHVLLVNVKRVAIKGGTRLITCRDISDRKRIADKLKESQDLLDAFFTDAPAGLVIHDDQLRYMKINRTLAEQSMMLSAEDHIGKRLEEVLGDFAQDIVPIFKRILDTGEPVINLEVKGNIGDQKEFGYWVFSAFPISWGARKAIGVISVNITEQKRAMMLLEKKHKELTTLFSVIRIASHYLNMEEMFSALMDKLEDVFDMEIVGVFIFDYDTQKIRLKAHRGISQAFYEATKTLNPGEGISGQAIATKEVVVGSPDNYNLASPANGIAQEKIQVLASLPLLSTNKAVGAINLASRKNRAISEDEIKLMASIGRLVGAVVENALLYKQVKSSAAELETRVRERTTELETARQELTQMVGELKKAKEEAERKAAELESFSYSVSHDLKAPLRGIDGYSRLLVEAYADRLDEEGLHFLQMVRASTEQMHLLIDDLLEYSRIGAKEMALQELNAKQLVAELVRSRSHDLQTGGIELFVDLAVDRIVAEPEGVVQALGNLLDNAIKFSRQRPDPQVRIVGYMTDQEWIFQVADNGIGFDMQYHDRVFGMFQRLERSEDFPGTGVGLAIVKKVVKRMGGRVWAESKKGQGATFYLALPQNVETKSQGRDTKGDNQRLE